MINKCAFKNNDVLKIQSYWLLLPFLTSPPELHRGTLVKFLLHQAAGARAPASALLFTMI